MDYINQNITFYNQSDSNINTTNISSVYQSSGESSSRTRNTFFNNDYTYISDIILQYVSTPVSVFGIIGNLLTLMVLTRRSLKIAMMTMERSSHEGLTALSVSDLFYCIAVLPVVTKGNLKNNPYFPIYLEKNFDIIYECYHGAVLNIFLTTSTWLTVMMASQRYIAICHPIKARQLIDYKYTRLIIIAIFLSAVFLNIPRFWQYKIMSGPCMILGKAEYCAKGPYIYAAQMGPMKRQQAKDIYNAVFFVLSILIPLTVLSFCNLNLIVTLRKSTRLRRNSSNIGMRSDPNDGTHRITLTLIIIVMMFIVLVAPGEISNFVWSAMDDDSTARAIRMNFSASVTELLQRINFSFNFILYCVINTHFRRTLYRLFFCKCKPENSRTSSATKRSFINLPTLVQNKSTSLDPMYVVNDTNFILKGTNSCGTKNGMTKGDYRLVLLKTRSCEQMIEQKH